MAYVGTLATPREGSQIHGLRSGGLQRAWSRFLGDLAQRIMEDRRNLKLDRALKDLDRRQLNDIGVCRDGC